MVTDCQINFVSMIYNRENNRESSSTASDLPSPSVMLEENGHHVNMDCATGRKMALKYSHSNTLRRKILELSIIQSIFTL